MSDRVLRSRARNGPTPLSLSEDREKVKFSGFDTSLMMCVHCCSAGRRRQKEVQPLNTVAQERFKHEPRPPFKKRVVFSSKRYSSDDLPLVPNGKAHGIAATGNLASPIHGILKPSPLQEAYIADVIDEEVTEEVVEMTTPVPAARGRSRTASRGRSTGAGRASRVSKHASFTEEANSSPWTSASSSILAALALSVSPLARKRAKQAEEVAKEEEVVRRAVQFYKSSGEWWNAARRPAAPSAHAPPRDSPPRMATGLGPRVATRSSSSTPLSPRHSARASGSGRRREDQDAFTGGPVPLAVLQLPHPHPPAAAGTGTASMMGAGAPPASSPTTLLRRSPRSSAARTRSPLLYLSPERARSEERDDGPGHTPYPAGRPLAPPSPSPSPMDSYVFPKTDYSYSHMSSYHHREISPGVPTLPNMSRNGLHNTQKFNQNLAKQLHFDSLGSDSDEVDDARSRNPYPQHNHQSVWKRVFTLIMTTITSLSTMLVNGNQTVYRHPQPKGLILRIWSSFRERVSNFYRWITSSTSNRRTYQTGWTNGGYMLSRDRRTIQSQGSNSKDLLRRYSRIIAILLLLPLLLFLIGWWFPEEDSETSIPQVSSIGAKRLFHGLWIILKYPLDVVWAIVTAPLSLWPSNFVSTLYDICLSPLILLQSMFDVLYSLCWYIVSLFQMLLAPILSLKINLWDSSENFFSGSESLLDSTTGIDNNNLKALLNSALQKQEESLLIRMSKTQDVLKAEFLSKMSVQEKQLRAELKAKEGFGQQLNLKVLHLQDELRRLRRRFSTCCRGSEPIPSGAVRGNLWEELKKLLSSPEGLILLGAAAAHATPAVEVDKSLVTIPQFNDTEIRAWISSSFLDKDDFEKALANMTKYFNEELERRSANMMTATAEEINAKLARQSKIHLAQVSKLQSELSASFGYQNNQFQRGATSSTTDAASSVDESIVRRIVDAAIAVYDADKTGMADYALESQGGQVVSTRCTETYQVKSPTLSVFGVPLWYPSNSPRTVIQPGMHPGECWAFVGSQGYLVIQLSHRIHVKGFTYEHISPVLLPTGKMNSAPKEFSVYGLSTEGDPTPVLLGDYHYLQNSTSMQFFPVQRLNSPPLQLIEIQVKSNHGNINYTCMYRFRVHGSIA
ncbi:SUN domain-containing protein 1 [Frankliniella fusca]|uniref:SUN domain-containing protein 1 n=1 Tax=Frankliniella fusca TaxID=407009 RepID=A0AAE1H205_9NEOP|nr:SUN domain-containing protein 1 [Frankliniella fusca]